MILFIVNIYLKKKNMIDFKNKTVLITGAAGHIGSYLSTYYESQGSKLILIDYDKQKISNLKIK